MESEDAGVPPLEPERPIERAAGVLRLASGQVDARRACCPGFRDRVLHEGSADTASSVIRSHDEVIEIRLRAGQGPELAQGDHAHDLHPALRHVRRRVSSDNRGVPGEKTQQTLDVLVVVRLPGPDGNPDRAAHHESP